MNVENYESMKTFNLIEDDFRSEKQKHKEEINQLKSFCKRKRKSDSSYIHQLEEKLERTKSENKKEIVSIKSTATKDI